MISGEVTEADTGSAKVVASRLLLFAVAGTLLGLWWLAASASAWATPAQDLHNQTVPTRTPAPPIQLDQPIATVPAGENGPPDPPTLGGNAAPPDFGGLGGRIFRAGSSLAGNEEQWGSGAVFDAEPASGTSLYTSPHERFGFCVAQGSIGDYAVEQLHAGWYVNFTHGLAPLRPAGMEYAQTVRVKAGWYNPATITTTLGPVVDANPGSLWLIGNEPDRRGGQDDRLPAEYAVIYHDLYTFLKGRDPSCRVAIGGVVQPTPLRLKYLDMVLDAYRSRYGEMIPVDVWNVHGFILREDWTWGAGIPPGVDDYQELGMLYEVQDNDSIEIFQRQIRAFRQWMADHGERDKPLIVSEYGVLMPPIYGFDAERVRRFMLATFDFFLTTTDDELGYPADGNRLIQRWAWYSLDDYVYDPHAGRGFNGNLFDPDTHAITPLGLAYGAYTAPDLAVSAVAFDPPRPVSHGKPVTVTITAAVTNRGLSPATGVIVRFTNGDLAHEGERLGPDQAVAAVLPGASQPIHMSWTIASSGVYTITAAADPDNSIQEADETNNRASHTLQVFRGEIFLPAVGK